MSGQVAADLGALSDLCTPWCVHVVATLGIADHIAAGITNIDDLGAAACCNPDSLNRVLRHLVGKGVFGEPAPGRFTLNETAQGLLDPSQCLGLDLDGFGGRTRLSRAPGQSSRPQVWPNVLHRLDRAFSTRCRPTRTSIC